MLCSHCQTPLQEGAKFCHKCGQTTQPTSHSQEQSVAPPSAHGPTGASVAAATPSTCPKCQQQPKPGLKFCNHCGWLLSTPVPETRRKKRRRKSSSRSEGQSKAGRIAVAVAVALLLVCGGVYFAFSGKNKSALASSSGPLTTEQALATEVYLDGKPPEPTPPPAPKILIPAPPQPAAAPPVPRWDPTEVVLEPDDPPSTQEQRTIDTKPKSKPKPKPQPAEVPPAPVAVPESPAPVPTPVAEVRLRPCSDAGLLMRPVCLVEGPQTFWKCTPDGKHWNNQIPGCRRSDEP